MKQAEVQLPDPLYQQVERLAERLHLSVPELLRRAAEQLVQSPPEPQKGEWRFPESRPLGAFIASDENWRLIANEASDA